MPARRGQRRGLSGFRDSLGLGTADSEATRSVPTKSRGSVAGRGRRHGGGRRLSLC